MAVLYLMFAAAAAGFSPQAAPKRALRDLFASSNPDAVLACPVDKEPLRSERVVLGSVVRQRKLSSAGLQYPENRVYTDLLPTAGRSSPIGVDELVSELGDVWASRVQTGLFRSPLTAFLYERGWRDNFKRAGFPGIEKEFEEVQEFFGPAARDGVVVDMSCGSGLMTRRLVKSGAYGRVLALDYSEAMLTETARRAREEGVSMEALTLCRADVSCLPLQSGAVDAMHAGAAMHCWPRLEEGLKEIRRVLKPSGGRFFATTFLQGAYGVNSRVAQQTGTGGGSFRFFEDEAELKQLLVDAGFPEEGVTVRKEGGGCAIIKAEVLPSPPVEDVEQTAQEE